MNEQRKSWGMIRRIYFGTGVLLTVGAATSFVWPGLVSPFLYAGAAVLVLGVALFASNELMQRVHRIFWRREWPK